MATKATLINPQGKKVVVDSGTPQAQQYFSQGYSLAPAAPVQKPQIQPTLQQHIPGSEKGIPVDTGIQAVRASDGAIITTNGSIIPKGSQIIPAGQIGNYQVQGQFGQTGQPGSGLYGKLKSSDINTNNLGGGGTMKNPPMQTPEDSLNSFVNDYLGTIQTNYAADQAKIDAQQANIQASQSAILDAYKKLSGKGEALTAQENKLGVSDNVKKLNELNTKIAARTAEFNNSINNLENQGRGLTTGIIGGQQNFLRRQQAIEIGGLSAVAQALQGNITLAQDTAKKTVDAEFAPIEQQITQQEKLLEFNYQNLTTAEKKQADNLAILLNKQKEDIAAQKEEKQSIYNVMLEAAKNGADTTTLKKIRNSKTVGDAITAAGNSLSAGIDGAPKKIGTDENGNDLFYDPVTKTVKTAEQITHTSSDGSAYFTDANGTKWNVGGWAANDASKVASMQQTANMIGKVDESNIEQKVAQFTPGITADMVKKASALTGVSWEAIMTQVVQESTGGTSNVAVKNNNFGGLTFNNQEWIKQFGGTKGTARPASEGGNYIKFPTKQDGLNALAALQASYGTVNEAPQNNETNQNIIQWGNELASTGKMPTGVPANFVGRVAQYANTVPKRDGLLVSTANGLPLDITPAQKDGLAAIYDLTKQIGQAKTLFEQLRNSLQTGAIGSLVGKIAPTEERQKYDSLRKNIWDLIARARTGAVIGEEEAKLYQSLVPSTYNRTLGIGENGLTKLDNLQNMISGGLETKLQAFGGDFIGREKTVGGKTLVRVYENGQLGWKDK